MVEMRCEVRAVRWQKDIFQCRLGLASFQGMTGDQ